MQAVVTLNNRESPSDMADLVEYAYGDAVETALGRQRAADMPAHPHPFQPFITEIGNEQALDATVSQRHLPPYFLGHFSPVLRRLCAVLLRFPASWRRDGENGRKMA